VPVHARRNLVEEPGQAIIRRVALGEVQVVDRQPGRLVSSRN
jgi:hypothetical protein